MIDIKGYEGQYAIDELGRVYSYKRKRFNSLVRDKKGYLRIGLRDSNNNQKRTAFLVHRLVAMTYLPNEQNKKEVNHKNNIRSDNSVYNLEWVTREENNQHAWDHGNKKFVKTDKFVSSVRENIKKAIAANVKRSKKCNTIM